MNAITYPEWRWDRVRATVHESRGPERVDSTKPDPTFRRRPVEPTPRHRREAIS